MPIAGDVLHEIGLLREQNATQQATIELLNGTLHQLRQYILQLEEFIRHGRRAQFGPSSERFTDPHPSLFDEAETLVAESDSMEPEASNDELQGAETLPEPAPKRKPRKKFRIPPELPRVDIIHDISEEQKICPHDGTSLKHIDSEIHEQLDIIPGKRLANSTFPILHGPG